MNAKSGTWSTYRFSAATAPGKPTQNCSGGDLNPILGFCFPLFSRVLPWGISIRVETCGSGRKQKCCKLLRVYVRFLCWLYPPELILGGVFEGDSVQGIGVGRLHVSQTRAEPTIAEMELYKGDQYRWNSWVCGCGLLSTIGVEGRDR